MTKQEEKLWVDFLQAIRDDNEDQVKIIISSGGGKSQFLSRKISTTQGTLALHLAVKHGNENIIKLLLERGADVNAIGEHRCTALHVAVDKDENRIIDLLLSQKDIDVDTSDKVENILVNIVRF